MKKIYIINGSGGKGKDTFVKLVRECMDERYSTCSKVMNVSSVDKIKDAALFLGWEGGKSEKDRKFLSDMKELASDYNDSPFKYIKNRIINFYNSNYSVLFIHIREPKEIERVKNEFGAETVLVTRDEISDITSNMADANVYSYEYDHVIKNNGTKDDLRVLAQNFIRDVILEGEE